MNNNVIDEDITSIIRYDLNWEKLSNKTILITGANGFLPAYMVETLCYLNDLKKYNIQILAFARNKEKTFARFKPYLNRKDLIFFFQDIALPVHLNLKLDYIIHAASQASPKYYGIDPVGTFSANVLGTYHLLELAKVSKVENFLYFSSGEVYGEVTPDQIPLNENNYGYLDPVSVRSCYAESKRMGENMCISYAHQHQLHVTIVRPFHIYGPGMSLNDGRVYADLVADIFHNRDITLFGTGTAVRSFCYLADATLGFFTLLLNGDASQAYNIGNPDACLSVMELAIRLQTLFSDKKLKILQKSRDSSATYLESKISVNVPDIKKIQQLGWFPKVSIEEGFLRTMRSFYEFDFVPG
ncbi:MAG: hypothetical protein RLY40_1093 [Pseudomonadota bacterium]|jgi:nucleoside-diphosphate-sugar epimerase